MNKYYFDHNNVVGISDWFDSKGFTRIDSILNEADLGFTDGDICFVHASNHVWWANVARKKNNVNFVFMSTDPIFQRGLDWTDNIHICRFPADRISELDRPKLFFEGLNRNKYLWAFLLPDAKSHLIALSILCQGFLIANQSCLPDDKKITNATSVIVPPEKIRKTWYLPWWEPVFDDGQLRIEFKKTHVSKEIVYAQLDEDTGPIKTLFLKIQNMKNGTELNGDSIASFTYDVVLPAYQLISRLLQKE
jgi:hypothetical protein